MALAQTPSVLANNTNATSYLNSLSNRVFIAPKGVKGISGFEFDYVGDDEVTIQTDITDHWNESNQAIQDHIAVKPTRVSLKGLVAELADLSIFAAGVNGVLSTLQNRLNQVPAYLGHYTPQSQQQLLQAITQAQNVATQLQQGLARVNNVVGIFSNAGPALTKQQLAYAQLSALAITQQLFVVVTPFEVYDNMAIEVLHTLQPGDTRFWSEFTVTMKQIRTTDVQSIPNFLARYGGRASLMNQPAVDKGRTTGTAEDSSILFKAFGLQ